MLKNTDFVHKNSKILEITEITLDLLKKNFLQHSLRLTNTPLLVPLIGHMSTIERF